MADGLDAIAVNSEEPSKPAAHVPKEPTKPALTQDQPSDGKPPADAKPSPEAKATPELADDIAGIIKPGAKPANNGQTPKELRDAYEAAQRQLKELQAERDSLTQSSRAELEKARQELENLQTELKYFRYEATPEFKQKYVEPLAALQKKAESVIKGAKIDLGEGQTRDATMEDVIALARMEPGQSWDYAEQMFGTRAPLVHQTIQQIRDGWEAMNNARNEWRQKGSEWEKQQAEREQQSVRAAREAEDSRMKELAEALPDIFGEPKDDPEAAQVVAKSKAFVDIAMGRAQFKEGISPAEQAKAVARARGELAARSLALPRALLAINRLTAQLQEKEAELAAFRDSEPKPKPTGGDKAPAGDPDDPMKTLDAMAVTVP